jgi:FkbM family methyltransferase
VASTDLAAEATKSDSAQSIGPLLVSPTSSTFLLIMEPLRVALLTMNGTAFWSWAYEVTSRKATGSVGDLLSKPLALAVRLIRRFNTDPIVRLQVGDRALLMPWSHNLPLILRSNPLYETEIGRLAQHLADTDGKVVMIDAGANIGDTIATLPKLDQAKFLCIEGSERYHDLLEKNLGSDRRVKPVFVLLTDVIGGPNGARVKEVEGTAHVEISEGSTAAAPWRTLDQLLEVHPEFKEANFCKVDCDGYDLRVLKGGTAFLERAKPCLHIEFGLQLWRQYGGCEADDGLAFLSKFGYKEVLVYDNLGRFIARDYVENPRILGVLADYTLRCPPWFYLNLIGFHETRKDLEKFYTAEVDAAAQSIEKVTCQV